MHGSGFDIEQYEVKQIPLPAMSDTRVSSSQDGRLSKDSFHDIVRLSVFSNSDHDVSTSRRGSEIEDVQVQLVKGSCTSAEVVAFLTALQTVKTTRTVKGQAYFANVILPSVPQDRQQIEDPSTSKLHRDRTGTKTGPISKGSKANDTKGTGAKQDGPRKGDKVGGKGRHLGSFRRPSRSKLFDEETVLGHIYCKPGQPVTMWLHILLNIVYLFDYLSVSSPCLSV